MSGVQPDSKPLAQQEAANCVPVALSDDSTAVDAPGPASSMLMGKLQAAALKAVAVAKAAAAAKRASMSGGDDDGDGSSGGSDFTLAKLASMTAEDFMAEFARADTSGDRKLSRSELEAMFVRIFGQECARRHRRRPCRRRSAPQSCPHPSSQPTLRSGPPLA
jgi:hypothetical protein